MKLVVVALALVLAVIADAAPLLHADSKDVVPGAYIVILKDGLDKRARDSHVLALKDTIAATGAVDSEIGWLYSIGSLVGFSARLSPSMLKAELNHPDVEYIECDQAVSINYEQDLHERSPEDTITQTGATWGLDRIDQRFLPLDGTYVYDAAAGENVDVYVLDTGILTTHVDFGDRASFVFTAFPAEPNTDLNGHGTHCSGTIGGTVYGVAKKVNLYAVKVVNRNGSGSAATIIAGVDYVTNSKSTTLPSVASVSLRLFGISDALDTAVNNSIAAGVAYSLAAGNEYDNACNYSPARVGPGVTVGATTTTDARALWSNFGTCVDIFAPGADITSDYIGSNTATAIMSGTSMATPHVAGILALLLSLDPSLTPAQSKAWIQSAATPGLVTNPGEGSPNLLAYSAPN